MDLVEQVILSQLVVVLNVAQAEEVVVPVALEALIQVTKMVAPVE